MVKGCGAGLLGEGEDFVTGRVVAGVVGEVGVFFGEGLPEGLEVLGPGWGF